MQDLQFNIPWPTEQATAVLLRLAAEYIEDGKYKEEARQLASDVVERMICSKQDFVDVLQKFSQNSNSINYSDFEINRILNQVYFPSIIEFFIKFGFIADYHYNLSIYNFEEDFDFNFQIYDIDKKISVYKIKNYEHVKLSDQDFETELEAAEWLFNYLKETGKLQEVIDWKNKNATD